MSEDPFVTYRSLLFTVAYEMLGSAADAEDVVQEAWLRWADVDQTTVRDPRAYLVRIVTRQALNLLRTVSRRREEYLGEWLPEPLLTSPDVAEDVELAESVSIAMLTVLETLTPTERAVFVLHEVFEVPYGEIAEALGKTPAAVRQIAHRARGHVVARRPRAEMDRAQQARVLERFREALETGKIEALLDVLAPDVVLVGDGGGLATTFPQPVDGAQKVAKVLSALARFAPEFTAMGTQINGAPALLFDVPGDGRTVVSVDASEGRVVRIYVMRNPLKLRRIEDETTLSRN